MIGRSRLTYDQLQTLVVEIEGVLNARPLTYVYDDVESISFPLTPSHLIYGRRIINSPNSQHYEVVSMHKSLTRRLRHHKNLLERFAKQWRGEYLQSLREHSYPKSGNKQESGIRVGDIVIVQNEKSNRNLWKLAKVEELMKGDDGVIRAAVIRTCCENSSRSQLLRRSIKHLIPIEARSSTTDVNEESTEPAATEPAATEHEQILCRSSRPQRQAAITGQLKRLKQSGKL